MSDKDKHEGIAHASYGAALTEAESNALYAAQRAYLKNAFPPWWKRWWIRLKAIVTALFGKGEIE